MAEKAAKSGDTGSSVVDLQGDDRWQERLAEARERRAQALKEMGRDDGARRKPRKPWEEDVTGDRQIVVEPSAKAEKKVDFLDRMDVLKRVTGSDKKEAAERTTSEPMPGRNWYPGAGKEADTYAPDQAQPIEAAPDVAQPIDVSPLDEPDERAPVEDDIGQPIIRSGATVDAIFDGPGFDRPDIGDKSPDAPEPPEAPVSLLLQDLDPPPRPSSASRPWLERNYEDENVAPVVPEAAEPSASDKSASEARKRRAPAWIGIAALFLIAIASGPLAVYSPWQPKAIGPATPFFGFQPAFGLTSPLVGFPKATSAADWRPVSVVPPTGPVRLSHSRPPAFVRLITPFDILPGLGAASSGVDIPAPATVLPILPLTAPTAPRLTLSMFERISGDPTRLVALPPVLAAVTFDAIKPVPRPVYEPLTQ